MAKMSQEIIDLFTDPQASKVMATISAEGTPITGVKGRLHAADEETIGFAELAHVKGRSPLKPGQKVAIAVFKMPSHGYRIQGTFNRYQTSGALFDDWAKLVKEKLNAELRQVGMIEVEEIYSSSGEKIA